ncbi:MULTISPECIES: glycosyltransferase [Delftia]|uniref:Glycosyltransferase n=1 Tax=Delftia lacustris TaxID=558537 RepID=A0A7T2YRX8_9BURK|nr:MULTISPECIES: glycosyltransferase [Delftia]EPD46116.1 hypothetical protein HMPREF9702_00135 [Delftia acidovorans CCUG 15835]QPS80714.1 glycosyltransferase [Delftia lacustris]
MPSSLPTIWFLSHRQHYDPRIYHIMAVYRDRGWHTVLFDPPAAQASALEWAELADIPWYPCTPLTTHEVAREGASEAVQAFLADLPSESNKGLKRIGSVRYQQTRNSVKDLIAFQVDGESQRYIYDRIAGQLWASPLGHSHAEMTAHAIAQACHFGGSTDELVSQLAGFTLEETSENYFLRREAGYERGEEFSIDKATGLVRQRLLPRKAHYRDENFLGHYFDYSDFKARVYEYVWEQDLVNLYLDKNPDKKPDVVFVSDLPVLPVGVMLKKAFGAKLIIDCHEWWSEQENIWNSSATDKIAAIDRWEKNLYVQCDSAITVSQTLAQTMSQHFGVPFHYVPTCVFDLNQLPARNPRFWQERVGLPENSSVVLFQGGLSSNRNLENLMRATAYFEEDQYLVICGDGGFRSEMEEILKRSGRPDRVRMLGWQPQLDLWQYTMHADLGIIPYTHTVRYYQLSAPNKLSEYHACELPMLVDKKMIELARVVNEDKIGRVEDLSSYEVMGLAIASMLRNKGELESYRVAYERVPERFTRTQCEKYMQPVFEMEMSQ